MSATAAFLTYNKIGRYDELPNGWHERNGRRAYVLQNTRGEGGYRTGKPIGEDRKRAEIESHFAELDRLLFDFDWFVIYVGICESERAIELAMKLPAERVIFVCCYCGLDEKKDAMARCGLAKATHLPCECGGHLTMKIMFELFLEHGGKPIRTEMMQ